MRIAIWAPVLYPWMIELGKTMRTKQHEVTIFSNGIFGNYASWKKFEKDVILTPFTRLFGEALTHPELFLAIFRSKPDLLIVFATESFTSMFLILFTRILRIRTVLIVENNTERKYEQFFKKIVGKLKWVLARYFHKKADVLVAESDASHKYLVRMGCSEDRIVTILHGTNIEIFKPEEVDFEMLKKFDIDNGSLLKTRVLYLGGFNYYKGVDYLITAIQSNEMDNVIFLIPVFGPLAKKYVPILDHKKNVILMPPVEYDKMAGLYNLSDIVIVPSLSNDKEGSERSPNVVIEAMACGKAVIGTEVGGIHSYIGDAGLIIPEKDNAGIAGAILGIDADKTILMDLKKKARKRAEEVFDIRKYADSIIEFSNRLIKKEETIR